MRLILLKCGICDAWYRPVNRASCPMCAAMPVHSGSHVRHYSRSYTLNKVIRIARAIPRVTVRTNDQMLAVANALAE